MHALKEKRRFSSFKVLVLINGSTNIFAYVKDQHFWNVYLTVSNVVCFSGLVTLKMAKIVFLYKCKCYRILTLEEAHFVKLLVKSNRKVGVHNKLC